MSAEVIETMMLIVRWADKEEMCHKRTSCVGCPYDLGKSCDTATTEYVLTKGADVFRKFLFEKDSVEN